MNSSSSSEKVSQVNHSPPHHQAHIDQVGQLYDRLLQAENDQITHKNHTIHKKLKFPQTKTYQNISDINDWLSHHLDLAGDAHILDAGCGVGGTLFSLLNQNRTGIGITLSPKQVEIARSAAAQLGLGSKVKFIQGSYDDAFEDTFDLVVSIEALTHSVELSESIKNLAQHLNPGGQIVLVEDMAKPEKKVDSIAEIFTKSWQLQKLYTTSDYQIGLGQANLELVKAVDLTTFVTARKWPIPLLKVMWQLIQRVPSNIKGAKDIFIGGLVLETLYAQGFMSYQVLIARKA